MVIDEVRVINKKRMSATADTATAATAATATADTAT